MTKNFDELTITDDFMFCKVMQNKKICKQLLETILEIKINAIRFPEKQKIIDLVVDAKSVRLDVFVEEVPEQNLNNTTYNIEMQTTNQKNLPERSRYYQGMTDLNQLNKGNDYRKLNRNFVIFFCTFDYFGLGKTIYKFENMCTDVPNLKLNDGAYKVFVNLDSSGADVSEEINSIVKFFKNGENKENDVFVKEIAEEVRKVRSHDDWRMEFMTLQEIKRESEEKGVEIGIEKGKVEMIKSLLALNMDIKTISKASGFSENEIRKIKTELTTE